MLAYLSTTEDYYSPLAPVDLFKRVQLATTSSRGFIASADFPFTSKLFWGKLEPDAFKIRRILRYYNALQPYVTGLVEPVRDGTGSKLRLCYQVPSWLLIVQALTVTIVIGLAVGYCVLRKGITGPMPFLIGLGLLTSFFVGGTRAFWNEVRELRRVLGQLLALEKTAA